MSPMLRVPTNNALQYTLDSQLVLGGTSLTLNQDVSSLVRAPGRFVIDRIDSAGAETPSKREFLGFTGVTTATLTGLTRGLMGSSDQAHAVGAIVEFVPDVETINSYYDTIIAGHATLGNHTGTDLYAADAGASDAYAVTLSPVPASYTTGMTVRFKANTVNTGATTLNVNGLGAKDIRKGNNAVLADGDIAAGSVVEVVYDGTNFRLIGTTSNTAIVAMQRRTTVQSINTTTVTKILCDTADKTTGTITNDTANSKITITTAGFYLLTLYMGFGDNTGGSLRIPSFYKNDSFLIDFYITKNTGLGGLRTNASHYVQLAVNDFIDIRGYQDSVGALNILGGAYFTVQKVSD